MPTPDSRSGRPIMRLLDLLQRRWALRVLYEVAQRGPLSWSEVQAACDGVSPSVLSQRLRELCEAGLLEQDAQRRYEIGRDGEELETILLGLDAWAKRWARRSAAPRGGRR